MKNTTFHPDAPAGSRAPSDARLNLLLSYSGWREDSVVNQLARLLEPLGILSIHANTGEEAQTIIASRSVHIAVVDLGIPLTAERQSEPGGPRILELLQRLDAPPPTVVVRPPLTGVREDRRTLADALRCGAFTVLDRPLGLETMLQTMRRVVQRHYADHWPDTAN